MILEIKPLTELIVEVSQNIEHKNHKFIFVVVDIDCNLPLHNESFEDQIVS